jgi:hypothetical protein
MPAPAAPAGPDEAFFGLASLPLPSWPVTPSGPNWAWLVTAASLLLPFLGTAAGIELAIKKETDLMGIDWYYRNEAEYEPRIRLICLAVTLAAMAGAGYLLVNVLGTPVYLSWTRFLLGFPSWWLGPAAGGACALVLVGISYYIAYKGFNN